MGVKLDQVAGSDAYRSNIYEVGKILVFRSFKPMLHNDFLWKILGLEFKMNRVLVPVHKFTERIIKQRREAFDQKSDDLPTVDADDNMLVNSVFLIISIQSSKVERRSTKIQLFSVISPKRNDTQCWIRCWRLKRKV